MLQRILVGLIFTPVVLGVLVLLPPVGTAVMVAVIGAMASYEFLRATKVAHGSGIYAVTALSAALIPLGLYAAGGMASVPAEVPIYFSAVLLMCALFFQAIRRYGTEAAIPVEHIFLCLFSGVVVPSCLACLLRLKLLENGHWMVLFPVISAFLTDTGAYFVGVFFGKHRGVTKVSPNKSLEGYLGGILAGALFMVLYGLALDKFLGAAVSLPVLAVYGLVGSFVTELGDLSFSLVKRQFGVKDYGDLMPGHGGMMDRFDSMTFAAPTLWVMVSVFPAVSF